MPRGGSKPGERRGGRKAGVPNRSTQERALEAQRTADKSRSEGKPLAKEVLERFMLLFAGMAQRHQEGGTAPDPDKFDKWAQYAVDAAKALAPYQSPTMRAIVVAPAPDQNQQQRVTRFTLNIFNPNGTPLRLSDGAHGSNGAERSNGEAKIIDG